MEEGTTTWLTNMNLSIIKEMKNGRALIEHDSCGQRPLKFLFNMIITDCIRMLFIHVDVVIGITKHTELQ